MSVRLKSKEKRGSDQDPEFEASERYFAVVGAPNSGKTTLYNHLTGSHFRAVNYPGSSVEYAIGKLKSKSGLISVIDTPGTYSLFPKSIEEKVTHDVLYGLTGPKRIDGVISVVDATQLARHLFFLRQISEAGFRMIVAVTMTDLVDQALDLELLEKELGCPVFAVNGTTGLGVDRLVDCLEKCDSTECVCPKTLDKWTAEHSKQEFKTATQLSLRVQKGEADCARSAVEFTRRIDHALLHPIAGIFIFFVIMTGLFSSIFWLAAPLMEFIDSGLSGVSELILNRWPNSLVSDLLANGIIASIGAVVVFVPQIAILFFLISILEDTGYLARAATLMDRPLSKLGLNGRSFVPLLSGYACAIPAMMAARTIPNKRERWLTLFIIPLMSCSARLPVYGLLLSFLFWGEPAWKAGLSLTALYMGSLAFGLGLAGILHRLWPQKDCSLFLLELPLYRRPHWRTILKNVQLRTFGYLKRAGPVIFFFAVVLWVATTFPNHQAETDSEKLSGSYAARAGQFIEPMMEPMGGDWRTGVSLIAAFAAREVFVGSLAVVLQASDAEDDELETTLLSKMRTATRADGLPLFSFASVLGLIVFFMIALQCTSTIGIARREFGNWRMPALQVVLFTAMAYLMAVGVVQAVQLTGRIFQ